MIVMMWDASIAGTFSIKKFNPETGEFEQFSKMAQKEVTQ